MWKAGYRVNSWPKPRLFFCHPEGKILLGNEAEGNNDNGGEHFSYRGENMELLYEQLDEYIVQYDANDHQQEIAHQLHPSLERGARKHDIAVQVKAGGETDGKSDQEGRNIGADSAQRRINDLFG